MASSTEFMDYVTEQIGLGDRIDTRRMFGEYAVYCDGKVVALVCDNRLHIKMTSGGRAFAADLPEAQPFPGAKPWLQVGSELDERAWLRELVEITARELPNPKPKKMKIGR